MTISPAVRIYLATGATDLRRSIDGLTALVRERFSLDPLSGHLFLFRNRRGDRLKILAWDGAGDDCGSRDRAHGDRRLAGRARASRVRELAPATEARRPLPQTLRKEIRRRQRCPTAPGVRATRRGAEAARRADRDGHRRAARQTASPAPETDRSPAAAGVVTPTADRDRCARRGQTVCVWDGEDAHRRAPAEALWRPCQRMRVRPG